MNERLASLLENRDSDLAPHRWKLREENIERITLFKVVEEVSDGNPGAREDGLPALNLRINDDQPTVHAAGPSWRGTRQATVAADSR